MVKRLTNSGKEKKKFPKALKNISNEDEKDKKKGKKS